MSATVSLREIVDHLGFTHAEFIIYFNKETGAIVSVSKEDLSLAEADEAEAQDYPDWQQATIQEARSILDSDDYLALPSQFDIHEYAIIQEFCYSVTDDQLRDRLLEKIQGSGAFRRFKNAIDEYDITDDWYRFRDKALKEIAIGWLEKNSIAYTDDVEQPGGKRG